MVFFDVIIWELFGKLENLSIFNSRLMLLISPTKSAFNCLHDEGFFKFIAI